MVATPPLGFCGVTIFRKYFTSNRSLVMCFTRYKVKIMESGAAADS